jgi:HEPN domain-containing protein
MKPNNKKEAERWLMQSERDLDDAKYVSSGKRYNVTCFLAHQAAEKALKAYLYSRGNTEVWGHSVAELCADSAANDPDFSKLKTKTASLDKYYIPTRYPNGLPGGIPSDVYQEEDAKQAVLLTDEIIKFVREKIRKIDNG